MLLLLRDHLHSDTLTDYDFGRSVAKPKFVVLEFAVHIATVAIVVIAAVHLASIEQRQLQH